MHALADLIENGKRIASQCFILDGPVVTRLVEDPESGCEWVELVAPTKGEIPEVRQAHHRFTREWLKIVPVDKTLMVRLFLAVA